MEALDEYVQAALAKNGTQEHTTTDGYNIWSTDCQTI